MTATQKRTNRKPKGKPRKQARRTVKEVSIFDKMLRAMPVTEEQVQKGLTVALVAVFILGAYSVAHYSGINERIKTEVAAAVGKAGFEVKRVEVSGVNRIDELKVYEITLAQKDRSMMLVDIDAVRDDLLADGWIKDARISRRLPDTLVVDIIEREPVAVWQNQGQLSLIDKTGYPLEKITREEIPDLPVIVGKKANLQFTQLDALLDVAPALRPMVTGATWIGNRRWDLEFDSGETLALPEGEQTASAALLNFARMDGVNRLLGRGVVHFDLRDAERAYLRMPPKPAAADQIAAGPES
ncbi:cell division protein FtsQ/DivIB [Parasphingorhabdus flavimaris]|jgi:cell division protein FtsQ|uniref:Cell division protein FtsQ n=1 Tax=Parasphingorhabdus flavimaris TaxID=266812 RepID=A0ABX2MYZ7_9SPHN|nr:cell division protein FtsQ/DivIB [Parasphingorhabdus flavimaris]NVD26658.1 FtsQ-type POTRA domain-containing protein [Parasphingorhabdus flavimaris]|tara:strand:+ start:63300 stop:64196 length:897 start_codon:yes stop_codon:yes gene_type:complete